MKLKDITIAQVLKNIAGQKFTWFALLMGATTITAFTTRPDSQGPFNNETTTAEEHPGVSEASPSSADISTRAAASSERKLPAVERRSPETLIKNTEIKRSKIKASSSASKLGNVNSDLVSYAQTLLGTPYNYGGTTKDGFDCSGFIYHVYSEFDIALQRSSRLQSTDGTEVDLAEIVPGDLLFFTGTNPNIREVGHVGIVISEPGEPVSFIHSSSNGGVKISELEGYYTTRYMLAKRVNN